MIFCSNSAPATSFYTRAQTEPPFGEAAMISVSAPPVAIAKLSPKSVRVGALVPSFVTSYQPVWLPR